MGEGYLSSRRNKRKSRGKLSLLLFGFRLVFASPTTPPPPKFFPSIKKEKENHSQRITGNTEYNSFAWKFERCP